ncbi:hypothetical protein VDG1235_2809 [Verrucomicrobiia bacterium DG1235]|nr:hypothetical protein VDG1235_2809 [Verrucomicrobiae bacterium DG1235]
MSRYEVDESRMLDFAQELFSSFAQSYFRSMEMSSFQYE